MIDKTNQPYSYMIADVEKAERELDFAHKKIKKLEDELKRMSKVNEAITMEKKGLSEDL